MLCSSFAASFSVQLLGDMETEPEEMVDEWLVTSDVESSVTADTGLAGTRLSPFSSVPPPVMLGGMTVVSSVLSGAVMGRE